MPTQEATMPRSLSGPEATVLAAVGGAAVTIALGWLTGAFRFLSSYHRRQETVKDAALAETSRLAKGLVEDLRLLNDRLGERDQTIAALAQQNTEQERRITTLERDGAQAVAAHTAALATALSERDARHAIALTALHEHYRQDIERRQAKYNEDMDELEQLKDRAIQALRDELRRGGGLGGVVC